MPISRPWQTRVTNRAPFRRSSLSPNSSPAPDEQPHGCHLDRIRTDSTGRRDGHADGAVCHISGNLHRGQAVSLVDEVAEGALQVRGFGGERAGGLAAAGVIYAQSLKFGVGDQPGLVFSPGYAKVQAWRM